MSALAYSIPSSIASARNPTVSQRHYEPASYAELTEPRERTIRIPVGDGAFTVSLKDSSLPAWVQPTIESFAEIQALSDNWDSYGGKAINRDIIQQALVALSQIMWTNSPTPSIVPLGDGGIQVEWHRKQQDLEIVFAVDERPQYYYTDRASGVDGDGSVDSVEALRRILSGLE